MSDDVRRVLAQSGDPMRMLAKLLLNLNPPELLQLRQCLMEEGGDGAGVGAFLPTDPKPREGGAEVPLPEWPDEYWESQT